jgi:hypothetical protein
MVVVPVIAIFPPSIIAQRAAARKTAPRRQRRILTLAFLARLTADPDGIAVPAAVTHR